MNARVKETYEHLLAAVEALGQAEEIARSVLVPEEDEAQAGEEPTWWRYQYGELGSLRRRLGRLTVGCGWDGRLLSVDFVREITVVSATWCAELGSMVRR